MTHGFRPWEGCRWSSKQQRLGIKALKACYDLRFPLQGDLRGGLGEAYGTCTTQFSQDTAEDISQL